MTRVRVNPVTTGYLSVHHTQTGTTHQAEHSRLSSIALYLNQVCVSFGNGLCKRGGGGMKKNLPPSKQVEIFEKIILDKLDIFCPEKKIKVSSQDKPWINAVLNNHPQTKYQRMG
jgi:hypothetical protein